MKTSCVLLICVLLESGTVWTAPKIELDDGVAKCEVRPSNDGCIFHSATEVKLKCSGKEWGPVIQEVDNTTSPQAQFETITSNDPLKMTIKYKDGLFVKELKVMCWDGADRDVMVIEQQYPISSATLVPSNIKVEAGETISLKCLADGNPEAEYEWHTKNKTNPEEKVAGANSSVLEIVAVEGSVVEYMCSAKNKKDTWKKSEWTTVTPIHISSPDIEAGSNPEVGHDKFIYTEESVVQLKCLRLNNLPAHFVYHMKVDIIKKNPIFPNEGLLWQTTENDDAVVLNIWYNTNKFIPAVNVTCSIVNQLTGITKVSTEKQVEMQYHPKSATIKEGTFLTVGPGTIVTLTCEADANPPPEYQWYNKTDNSDVLLPNAKESVFNLSVPLNWSSFGRYFCGAKNVPNANEVLSPSVEVSAIIPPVFKSHSAIQPGHSATDFSYKEVSPVLLSCFLPGAIIKDINTEIEYKIIEANPVYPKAEPSYKSEQYAQYAELSIEYKSKKFVPVIQVSCHAKNRTNDAKISTSTILIKQLYKTENIKIKESSPVSVEAGNKVKLTCLADGNPHPTYQWYNKTENDDVKIEKETKETYELTIPANTQSVSNYFCSAKNEHNAAEVNSAAVTVTGTYIPPPTLTSSTPTSSSENNPAKNIYLQQPKVVVSCAPPPSTTSANLEVIMEYEHIEDNPVFRSERTKFNKTKEPDMTTLEIDYNVERFVPRVEVRCSAVEKSKPGVIKSVAVLQIEQEYSTKNVIIPSSEEMIVHPQEEVTLTCIADGNPNPKYQWFKMVGSQPVVLENVTDPVLQWTAKSELVSEQYFCTAWNTHNEYPSNSSTVKVSVLAAVNPTPRNSAVTYRSDWLLLVTISTLFMNLAIS